MNQHDPDSAPLSFEGLNRPWHLVHPSWAIRGADLLVIGAAIMAWIGFLTFFFNGSASSGNDLRPGTEPFAVSIQTGILLSTGAYIVGLAGLFWLARQRGYNALTLGFRQSPYFFVLAVVLVWFVLRIVLDPILVMSLSQPGMSEWREMLSAQEVVRTSDILINFLFWIVVAFLRPMALHLVFRGWFFHWLRVRVNFWFAAIISSLLAASVQVAVYDSLLEYSTVTAGLIWAFYYFVLAFALCALTEASKSLWPGMMLSVLFPLMSLAAG